MYRLSSNLTAILLLFLFISPAYALGGFMEGTQILTPNGGYFPIEQLKTGDEVYSLTNNLTFAVSRVGDVRSSQSNLSYHVFLWNGKTLQLGSTQRLYIKSGKKIGWGAISPTDSGDINLTEDSSLLSSSGMWIKITKI